MLNFIIGVLTGSILTLILLACLSVSSREEISEQIYQSYWRGWHAGRAQLKSKEN